MQIAVYTGTGRVGSEVVADYAIALVDEIERRAHRRERFAAAGAA